jgi:hypothetical protein
MDHLETATLKARYRRVVAVAWALSMGEGVTAWTQGIALSEVAHRLEPHLREGAGQADEGEVPFIVRPETLAPLVSISQDPRAPHGRYMVVDMGGGTTEVSVDHVGPHADGRRLLCYRDRSDRIGAEEVRGSDGQRLVPRLVRLYHEVWKSSYAKEKDRYSLREPWRRLRVLLVGGGARLPAVSSALRTRSPLFPWPAAETTYSVAWHVPVDLDVPSGSREHDDLPLLTVAHGLSIERWPDFFPPDEVSSLGPTAPVPEAPSPDWYQER